jgi:hypothetical protein
LLEIAIYQQPGVWSYPDLAELFRARRWEL